MRSVLASAVALSSVLTGTTLVDGPLSLVASAQQANTDPIRRVIVRGNERLRDSQPIQVIRKQQ